jgi:hypothetical protein
VERTELGPIDPDTARERAIKAQRPAAQWVYNQLMELSSDFDGEMRARGWSGEENGFADAALVIAREFDLTV